MKALNQSILFLLIIIISCDDNEVTPREYPRLHTLEVSSVNPSGATFNAEITYRGNFEILQHGFVWSDEGTPSLQSGERVIYQGGMEGKTFSTTITTMLETNIEYYVRPFVKTHQYFVYGKIVSFKSLGSGSPVISDFSPMAGAIGDTIAIRGAGFSYNPQKNIVLFGTVPARVAKASDTLLMAIVPQEISADASQITVAIVGKQTTANQKFTLKRPQLLSAGASTINVCDTLTLNAENVGAAYPPKVFFNGTVAQHVSVQGNRIKVVVPFVVPFKPTIEVKIRLGAFESQLPELLNFNRNRFTIEPAGTSFLDTLTIRFTHMPECGFEPRVEGKPLKQIEKSSQFIRAVLPASFQNPWYVELEVLSGNDVVFDTTYQRVLSIESITPAVASPGETIVIKGRGFHPVLSNNTVCFDCHGTGFGTHGQIVGGDIHTLRVKVPQMPAGQTHIHLFTQNIGTWGTPFEVK